MNKLAIIAVLLVLASSAPIHDELKSVVEEVNNKQTTWTAGVNERHEDFTMESLKSLLGSLEENVHEKLSAMVHEIDESTIPTEFFPAT